MHTIGSSFRGVHYDINKLLYLQVKYVYAGKLMQRQSIKIGFCRITLDRADTLSPRHATITRSLSFLAFVNHRIEQ